MHEASAVATELARKIGLKRLKITMQVLAVFLLLILLWRMHPYSKRGTTDCAFRVTNSPSTRVQIEGDGVPLNRCVKLEKAVTPSSQVRGLSGRDSMSWDRGMLFDFKEAGEHCMWMKDMHFPLDIVWLNEQREIVGIRENVSPDTYPTSFCGPQNARYVIEVNAHGVESGNLRMGQRLNF
jgi:uncharacterized membrane protein (UPF0127 family)